ncbi:recombinase family protein [Arsenicicoccus dermatophilus]|uniref:recombinase family protein n=1 Tax=Arsenicicoccus dermatophilus TaxID=1076331 RepID=UPI001F4C921E|nr:recombinase family protein [Arsenicicoccus dermatophilus]MCH8613561.1 recombinase family protein [Arsenicicoccus dermatophilus]
MSESSCVVYCRISLDKTGLELGVDRQERACLELAERMGWTVAEVYRDNSVSATSRKPRPAFEAMLAARPARIVMWSVDRLVRKGPDLERLIDLGVPVHSCQAGPMDLATASGRLNARLLVSVATFEGEMKAERQRLASRQRREQGRPAWSVRPFGFNRDGSHREDEAALLRHAYGMLDRGETVEAIRQWMNAQGSLTPKGNPWRHSSILSVLRHPRNGGLMVIPAEGDDPETLIPAAWEGIVSAAEWRRIMGRSAHRALTGRGQGKRKALLSGVVTCGRCGGSMRKSTQPRTGRPIYSAACAHVTAPLEVLDASVRMSLVLAALTRRRDLGAETVSAEAAEAGERAEALRARVQTMTDMLADGDIDRAEYRRATAHLRSEVARLEAVAETAHSADPWAAVPLEHMLEMLGRGTLPLVGQQALIRQHFRSVELLPKSAGTRFDPRRHLRLVDHDGNPVPVVSASSLSEPAEVAARILAEGGSDDEVAARLDAAAVAWAEGALSLSRSS